MNSKKKNLVIEYVSGQTYSEEEVKDAKQQLSMLISTILVDEEFPQGFEVEISSGSKK